MAGEREVKGFHKSVNKDFEYHTVAFEINLQLDNSVSVGGGFGGYMQCLVVC